MAVRSRIRVGTSSWADPGFVEEWYPRDLAAYKRLEYYARHFDLVEVNSTFYAIPSQKTVERWVEQTPERFRFDVKLPKILSRHSASADTLPAGLRSSVETTGKRVVLSPGLEEDIVEILLESLEPLTRSGKLGAMLLQMTPGFGPRDHKLEELTPLIRMLRKHNLAVELRNRSWVTPERMEETLEFFEQHDVVWVCVDAPTSNHFTVMPRLDAVTNPKLAYLRMHGRNREGYVRGRSVAARFDYDYSEDELREHAVRADRLAEDAAEVHILYNNNKGAYAPEAAERLKKILEPGDRRKAAA
jgi:uncharacterized protein YecE (DUF72 family)